MKEIVLYRREQEIVVLAAETKDDRIVAEQHIFAVEAGFADVDYLLDNDYNIVGVSFNIAGDEDILRSDFTSANNVRMDGNVLQVYLRQAIGDFTIDVAQAVGTLLLRGEEGEYAILIPEIVKDRFGNWRRSL